MIREARDSADTLEEVVETPKEKRPSLKENYLQALGKPVSLDFFLFTCHEEEVTLKSLKAPFRAHINTTRWPHVASYYKDSKPQALKAPQGVKTDAVELASEETATLSPVLAEQELTALIPELCRWYAAAFPLLAGRDVMDYSIHAQLLQPFVLLSQDFATLVHLKLGRPMAAYAAEDSLPSDQALWQALELALKQHFPAYAPYMLAYFQWYFRIALPPTYDLASIPPVGRYALLLQRSSRKAQQKAAAEQQQARWQEREREAAVKAVPANKEPSSQAKEPSSQAKEKEALAEVEEALQAFGANLELQELSLSPQNSYLRRLQHQRVVEKGFKTESSGEGALRAVKILR